MYVYSIGDGVCVCEYLLQTNHIYYKIQNSYYNDYFILHIKYKLLLIICYLGSLVHGQIYRKGLSAETTLGYWSLMCISLIK